MAAVPRIFILALSCSLTLRALAAQDPSGGLLGRAFDLETSGKCAEAIPLYRRGLWGGDPTGPLLGLERCYNLFGRSDSLLAIVDSVLRRRPRDPVARQVQLRTLLMAQRDAEARMAFSQWVGVAPRDPMPFRQFAQLLLDQGRVRAADSVLQLATVVLGGRRQVAPQLAELKASLQMWEESARAWRDALADEPYLEQTAIFVLLHAPAPARDSVRAVLAQPPVELTARRVLAGLELRWRSAREGWLALQALQPSDSVVDAWLEFAAQAEEQGAWLAARDAYAWALRQRPLGTLRIKAAAAALQGGEPRSALELLPEVVPGDSALVASYWLLRVRALAQLGLASEAETAADRGRGSLGPVAYQTALGAVAWGWVRVGDTRRARAALEKAGAAGDDQVGAWLALYDGNLEAARVGLRRVDEPTQESVAALALLARTSADSSRLLGEAFLALARRDSAVAAARFSEAALALQDAAPLLLAMSARIYLARGDTAGSLALWQRIVEHHANAPEAAEAELEWGRALARRGDASAAVARLEHMILAYPRSALVAQARQELERLRGAIPPL